MDASLLLANLSSPPILFFVLGGLACWLKSDLEIPHPLPKLFSLYLLLAIGFQGGVKLRHGGLDADIAVALLAGVGMSAFVAWWTYRLFRLRTDPANAAALAATYGSVSAVTFLTATSFLSREGIPFGGHMIAMMALMESPAIIVGVLLARRSLPAAQGHATAALWREGFTNSSVFLLLGSLAIGALSGPEGGVALKPFTGDLFKGMLCFFLLDLGMLAAKRLRDLGRAGGGFLTGCAIAIPLVNAALALGIARLLGFGPGDAVLFVTLCASASYIAVPAAMRLAVPEANPGLFVALSLGVTFPFNITVGLPLYAWAVSRIWGG